MIRLMTALAPLLLVAGAAAAQDHSRHATPARPPIQAPAADPHAGHVMPAPARTADPHAGHDMAGVRVLSPGAQGAGGEDQRSQGDSEAVHDAAPSMGRTVTTLNMPACMCISMWQWKAQSPGASAVRSKVTLPPGATLTVCFSG